MTLSIVDFLRERLAEDEAAASRAAAVSSPQWIDNGSLLMYLDDGKPPFAESFASVDNYRQDEALVHAARHDPARVLREVSAKRAVMERHRLATELEMQSRFPAAEEERRFYPGYLPCVGCGDDGGQGGWKPEFNVDDINNCPELRDLAAVYSDHPDYNPAWAIG
jgi:hypothetical protein